MIPVISIFRRLLTFLRVRQRERNVRALRRRFENTSNPFPDQLDSSHGISLALDDIDVRVINLEHRSDRWLSVSQGLHKVGINRFSRVVGFNGPENFPRHSTLVAGSIGCELAHISAVAEGFRSGSRGILVCEDDLEFLCSESELRATIEEFFRDERLDVLVLAGRPRGGSFAISDRLRIVIGLVGRGAYLLKPHMAAPLTLAFAKGLEKLLSSQLSGKGDLMWRNLQQKSHFFAFPRTDLARQREGYSDIENKVLGPR